MKIIFCITMLMAGATTMPLQSQQQINWRDERLITGSIESAIQDISQAIQDHGLDPLDIEELSVGYELPVPVIVNAIAALDKLYSYGLSNIVIHRLSYSLITFRLNFDVELPLIHFSLGNAEAAAELFGYKFDFNTSGKIEIHRIRVVGQVRVSVGIISGISIRGIDVAFTLGDISSDVDLNIQGVNYSNQINQFISKTCPDTIKAYNSEINELLEILLLEIINANL